MNAKQNRYDLVKTIRNALRDLQPKIVNDYRQGYSSNNSHPPLKFYFALVDNPESKKTKAWFYVTADSYGSMSSSPSMRPGRNGTYYKNGYGIMWVDDVTLCIKSMLGPNKNRVRYYGLEQYAPGEGPVDLSSHF